MDGISWDLDKYALLWQPVAENTCILIHMCSLDDATLRPARFLDAGALDLTNHGKIEDSPVSCFNCVPRKAFL